MASGSYSKKDVAELEDKLLHLSLTDSDEEELDLSLTDSDEEELKESIEKNHADLVKKLPEKCPKPIQQEIDEIYHVTDADGKKEIEKAKTLEASVASQSGSPIDEMELECVYFRLNLKKKKLPTTSPFGTKRVCIPISDFSEYDLFFNHYKRGNPSRSGGHENYYVSLVLVKPSHNDYDDIKKVFKKLDPEENHFVYFDHEEEDYYYTDYYKLNELQPGKKRRKAFNVYYEIAVVGDVPLDDDAVWDTVKKK